MPRPRNPVPTYRLHRASGQAVTTFSDSAGNRRDVYLGAHGSDSSKAEYERVLAEWRATGGRLPRSRHGLTVAELLLAYWQHAESYYRHADGRPTGELDDIRLSFRPIKKLYGHSSADDFGPRALKAVREEMIRSGLCRGVVNQRIGKIKRAFRWGVAEEFIPSSVYHGLAAIEGLKRGRTEAREPDRIKPVPADQIEAVLPHVRPPIAAMIELQRLTGMRPGEVVIMRGCDVSTAGPVWTYRPQRHKNDWRGRDRVIFIGPRAQAVLKPFLTVDPTAFFFSPARDAAALAEERRAGRVTKLWPSHVRHQKKKRVKVRRRPPRERYSVHSYNRAIARGVHQVNRQRRGEQPLAPPDHFLPLWCANRLRHTHGTDVRKAFGIEAARVLLGHSRLTSTEIYAEKDLTLAERIAAEVG